VAFSVPPRLCGEGLALSILDNQENSLDNLAQAPHPKALRASLSRRPCTTKKRHSAETAGCRVSSSHLIEEQTPTYRCSSPGGANELSPGAEALGNHAEQHKSPVGGDTPIFFPACHPGQPRTTRNLTDRPVPPPAILAFSYTTSHPHAIQVSGHEFTRAVRMNKTPFPCAAGSRSLPFPSDIASARDTSVRARVHSCRQDERMPLPCAAGPGAPTRAFAWRGGDPARSEAERQESAGGEG
jgi:hypothetical protein